jgi:hypothetical protein
VINWMLEVEGVEDAPCTVDDMDIGGGRMRGKGETMIEGPN